MRLARWIEGDGFVSQGDRTSEVFHLNQTISFHHQRTDSPDGEETTQLLDRLGVIIDAEIAVAISAGVACALLDDEESGRLHPAGVAPGLLAFFKGTYHPLAKHAAGFGECPLHGDHGLFADQDVALDGEVRPGAMAGPCERLGSGVRDRPSLRIHDSHLPVIVLRIVFEQARECLLNGAPFAKELQSTRAVYRVAHRLTRNCADIALRKRHGGSHGEEPRLDSHTQLAC
jgi:hypothetical protein